MRAAANRRAAGVTEWQRKNCRSQGKQRTRWRREMRTFGRSKMVTRRKRNGKRWDKILLCCGVIIMVYRGESAKNIITFV